MREQGTEDTTAVELEDFDPTWHVENIATQYNERIGLSGADRGAALSSFLAVDATGDTLVIVFFPPTSINFVAACVPVTEDLWLCSLWAESLEPVGEPSATYTVDLTDPLGAFSPTNDLDKEREFILYRLFKDACLNADPLLTISALHDE